MPPRRISQNDSPAHPHPLSVEPSESSSPGHYEMRRSSASSGSSSAPSGSATARPEFAPAGSLLKHVFVPLAQSRSRFVDLDKLNRDVNGLFKFSLQWMDFRTGKVVDSKGNTLPADLYFRPAPPAAVQAWLKESRPWSTRYDYVASHDGYSREKQAATAAFFVIDTIDAHIRDTASGSHNGAMSTHTSWACIQNMPPMSLLYQQGQEYADWTIRYVYRQSLNPVQAAHLTMPANPEKPHTVVSVIDGTPLRNGVLCTSELATLLYFAAEASLRAGQRQHAFYPVMVVAASCDTVRVTQAIWDVKKAKIEIRMTGILEFPKGFWDRESQYYHLLGWMLSDVGGKTR